ncbi:MAG: hypothetical protein JWM82_2736, partial [Myxococcales bacterium]|nr:hypothetical protein [Myxococcales bacterium]
AAGGSRGGASGNGGASDGIAGNGAGGGATAGAAGGTGVGGMGGAQNPLPPLTGRHSFVVDAKITIISPGANAPLPSAHTFTIVLDFDANFAMVGSAQGAGEGLFSRGNGGAIELKNNVSFSFSGCFSRLTYQVMSLKPAADGTLTGTATGKGEYAFTDLVNQVDFTATLTGVADRVTPTLSASAGVDLTDPFVQGALVASEPLPVTVKPSLASSNGETFELTPNNSNGLNFRSGFAMPKVFLGYGETYTVVANGLADFAGNISKSGPSIEMKPAPPLAAEDGFESLAPASLAGGIVSDGTNGPVIMGTRSFWAASTFALRLAVKPGDSVVRFSYRLVGDAFSAAPFGAQGLLLGARGAPVSGASLPDDNGARTLFNPPGQAAITLSAVHDASFPLPTGTTNEVVLTRVVSSFICGLPPQPSPGLVIDDLRAE